MKEFINNLTLDVNIIEFEFGTRTVLSGPATLNQRGATVWLDFDGKYRLTTVNPPNRQWFESDDLLTWTDMSITDPINNNDIRGTCYIREGSTSYMFGGSFVDGKIYRWSGSDVENMTADGIILEGTIANPYLRYPDIIKRGSTFYMFVDVRTTGPEAADGWISYATSTDLTNWTLHDDKVVDISPEYEWQKNDITDPRVILIDNIYYMFWSGYDGSGDPWPHEIGYSYSLDLVNWVKVSKETPVLALEPTAPNSDDLAVAEDAVILKDNKLWMFYQGKRSDPFTSRLFKYTQSNLD